MLLASGRVDRDSKDELGMTPLLWAKEGFKAYKGGSFPHQRGMKRWKETIKLLKLPREGPLP